VKNSILNSARNYKFAILAFTALSLLGWSNDAKAQKYWNTSGTGGTWTSSLWGSTAGGPFNTAWASSSDVVFGGSVPALITFATATVGNITVNTDTTVSQAGTLSFKTGGSNIDVAAGKTLTWVTQNISTSGVQAVTKSGSGTWNIGAQGNALAAGSSFTLNGGTVIVSGNNSLGGANAALSINGGIIQSSGTRIYANSAITIGGNFENSGTGNATWSGTVNLGNATRTINNTTTAGSRSYTGIISGAVGSGLSFTGAGTGLTFIGNTANTFSGPIVITGGEVIFNNNGAFGNSTSITLDGGRLSIASDNAGTTAITAATIAAARNLYVGSTSGTSLSVAGSTGVTTYNGVIADKQGSTGLLAKQGAGTLVLGGVNTYTGDTTIGNGTVRLDLGNDRLPTGTVVSFGSSGDNLGTLDLNGRSQQVAGLVSKLGTSTATTKNTVTSAVAATLDINVAEGTTRSYGDGTTQNSGVITGLLGLTKSGLGTQVLGDANTYSGTTTVNAGTLAVNGSITSSSAVVNGGLLNVNGTAANVTVNSGGSLGGSGKVGAITGAGTVGPGNSPGLLTATSVNPTAGTDFKFEFTALNPTYTSATASGNDLLHLTASSSPFAGGTFGAGNIISIYLNSSIINDSLLAGQNTSFSGGFFVDGTYGLAAALSPASFAYYTTSALLGTGSAVNYGGTDYYLLNSEIAAKTTLTDTAVASAAFSTGTVAGTVLTFNAVPEPSAQSLLAFGMAALVAVRSMRRKQS
jgi:autotransporter-associated beta strand protein